MGMRRVLFLLSCLCWAGTDLPQLRKLYDTDRMFELRRALAGTSGNSDEIVFYRAAVDARFGNEEAAIDKLHHFLETPHSSELERKANEELAGALERIGKYGDAAQAWAVAIKQMQAKDPDRADEMNTQQLNEALRYVPPQTVHLDPAKTVQARKNGLGSWNVPVEANGRAGDWIFDTGANMSTVTESEARRMNFDVRDTTTYVNGSTGKKNPLRLAVAKDLRFGDTHLRNVVFLVLNDQALYIGPLKYQIDGILGLPAIRALGRLTMSDEGVMQIQPGESLQPGEPNLFFAELTPMIESRHGSRELQMFLDSGNNTTFLYPSSRNAFGASEMAHLKKKREQMGGAGGTTKRTAEVIPSLTFEILGKEIELKALSLLSKQPPGKMGNRDGVFGADVLSGGFTLDFLSMEFRIH